MDFPNEHFYNSGLKILPEQLAIARFQTQTLISKGLQIFPILNNSSVPVAKSFYPQKSTTTAAPEKPMPLKPI
ncbi:MAG: hypothetical protein HC803_01225 [Saprospiraceae bacterium]|nr:hypothetical protein [Saprospiraceae bacterium]